MSAGGNMSRRDELEALLPFYLNGTLEGDDLEAVEEWLASDPEAAVALAEADAEFGGAVAANEALRPPADALSRFSKALEAEAGPARAESGKPWLAGAWERIAGLPAGLAWATAAAAVMLLVVQAALDTGRQGGDFEIAGEGGVGMMPFAFVKFRPGAEMADISAFLVENGAAIAGGPTAGGVFRIAIPAKTAADYDRLVGLIAAQPFTETVSEGRKPANGG
jgi:hypothetical protein